MFLKTILHVWLSFCHILNNNTCELQFQEFRLLLVLAMYQSTAFFFLDRTFNSSWKNNKTSQKEYRHLEQRLSSFHFLWIICYFYGQFLGKILDVWVFSSFHSNFEKTLQSHFPQWKKASLLCMRVNFLGLWVLVIRIHIPLKSNLIYGSHFEGRKVTRLSLLHCLPTTRSFNCPIDLSSYSNWNKSLINA